MNENEFLEAVAQSSAVVYYKNKKDENSSRWQDRRDELIRKKKTNTNCEPVQMDDYIQETWVSGGVSGGSCWDTSDDPARYRSRSSDPEPEFRDFDAIIEYMFPEITFMKYKKLITIVKYDSRTENEYYGNSTEYGIKKVVLSDLYQKIKELGLELKSDD